MTCSHCGKTAEQNNNWVLCPYYKYAPVCMTHCYSD
nr:MAG TPA: zinc-ribbon domain protein [Caudoviricetes sp.]